MGVLSPYQPAAQLVTISPGVARRLGSLQQQRGAGMITAVMYSCPPPRLGSRTVKKYQYTSPDRMTETKLMVIDNQDLDKVKQRFFTNFVLLCL